MSPDLEIKQLKETIFSLREELEKRAASKSGAMPWNAKKLEAGTLLPLLSSTAVCVSSVNR